MGTIGKNEKKQRIVMSKHVTIAEWAKNRGVPAASLYKYVNSPEFEFFVEFRAHGKTLVLYPDIDNYLNAIQNEVVKKAAKIRTENRKLMEGDGNPGEGEGEDYEDVKKVKLEYQGKMAKAKYAKELYQSENERIKFEKAEGVLIERDLVHRNIFQVIRTLRNKILSIPDRFSPQVSGMTDPREIHILMTKEITEGLSEMVDSMKKEFATFADLGSEPEPIVEKEKGEGFDND